jgi:geranylgeranyl diphosphate synthase type II
MHSLKSLREIIRGAFTAEKFIQDPPELYDPIAYTLDQGGKRLRPLLVLMACDLFGGTVERAVFPALGLEIFHNFTLLHDDIMDQAPLRRGRETVHKKWDANRAILSGDTMFVMAYEYVAKTDPALLPAVLNLFNTTARQVCEGQQYDMNFERQEQVSIADYMMMIRLKTAVLIACSLKLGAILAPANPRESDKIYDFGINLGLAFQLQDDYLDVFGDKSRFGKEIGGDILTNKKTFLYLKAFEQARGDTLVKLTNYYFDKELPPKEKIEKITEIYRVLKVDQATRKETEVYFSKALKILGSIETGSDRKQELLSLANNMLNRDN